MPESDLKRITGLWLKDGKNGKYMNGNVSQEALQEMADGGPLRLMVFKNNKKKGERDPDYYLFGCPDTRDTQRETQQTYRRDEDTPF